MMEKKTKMVELTETELQMLYKAAWVQAQNLKSACEHTSFSTTEKLLDSERIAYIDLWTKLGLELGDF